MRAILVRVFVDGKYGGWNAPVDPVTGEFVYVPIPDDHDAKWHTGCERRYSEVRPVVDAFLAKRKVAPVGDFKMPRELDAFPMHLDPDFEHLTYGDVGDKRGAGVRTLRTDDLVVFYAGLRSTRREDQRLVYGIVGLYVVDEVVSVDDVPLDRAAQNAHTRRVHRGSSDFVLRAKRGLSGRCERCVSIGEFWPPSNYFVRPDLFERWGGFKTTSGEPRNGYLTMSAVPPEFVAPERFLTWWREQGVRLVANNFG